MDRNKTNKMVKMFLLRNGFIKNNLDSFNDFIEWRLQKIIDEIGTVSPAVIPSEAETVEFKLGRITIGRPIIFEADGSDRPILPSEARMRDLTYSAPVYLEITLLINGKEREQAEVHITNIPVMVRSKLCYLSKLKQEEIFAAYEDPNDLGGYFIINGTERALILLEDLAPNTIFVSLESSPLTHSAKIYSASGKLRIPHTVERKKDGTLSINFSSVRNLPLFLLIKGLGLTDKEIYEQIKLENIEDDLFINLYDISTIKNTGEAGDFIAKELKLPHEKDQQIKRIEYLMDKTLLPHVGDKAEDRKDKARFLCKIARKLLLLKLGKIVPDVIDHYANKRIRLAGDLLEDLMRANLKSFVNDMLYVFQRGVRRGAILPISSMIQTKFLTQRINSAMATGAWTGGRQGMSQRLERHNALITISHLRRVSSLLQTSQENFEARALHSTHWGKLCPIETPESKNIGLRKNLALLADISPELSDKIIQQNFNTLKELGLKVNEK